MNQSEESLKEILEKIVADEKLKEAATKIVPISTEGANYTSTLYKIEVTSSNKATLHLFAKVAVLPESIRPLMQAQRLYDTERLFYTEIQNAYEDLQMKNGIPVEEMFKFPKLYGFSSTYLNETIVLEDLSAKGFTMFDRFKSINWEYAKRSIEELAKFHALSFAYKIEYPKEFENNYAKLVMTEKDLPPMETFQAMWDSAGANAFNALSEELKVRLRKFADSQLSINVLMKYYGPGKWQVLTHSDYRNSNIMFKRQGGKVSSLVPVDYQTLKLGSPVLDILYFIYSGTDAAFRRVHLKQLLDLYYITMSDFMRKLKVDPETIYSRKDYEEDYRDHIAHGLNTATFILPLVLVQKDSVPDISQMDKVDKINIETNLSFQKRYNEIFEEYIKLGVV